MTETPSAFAGRLSLVALSDLLERMEANGHTGELRLKTDFGPATVWFSDGVLLDAEIGSFQGEAAIFRLLGLTDGTFEVKSPAVSRARRITQPVRTLLRLRSQRSVAWQKLVEKLPPLGTVLVLDLQSFSAASESLTDDEMAIVQLVDGRRAIFEIIADSGADAVQVLEIVDALISRGLVSADQEPPSGLHFGEAREGESGVLPPSSHRPSGLEPEASPATERAPNVPATDSPPSATATAAGAPPWPPPAVRGGPMLGRYEVLSRLGRGGMGTVYQARVTGEGGFRRLFAIKVLRSHLTNRREATEMLLKEARIASRMDHPNIVSVVDVGEHEGQPYLVMDYVTGCSLADLLKSASPKASTAAAVSIVLDTLAGLNAAHSLADDDGVPLDVIHHDVSPHNVMVGEDGIARLSDFGVAYVRRSMGEGAQREASRGKPAFTAPERVRGGAGDHRSDLFSVGVILWNALTRTSLFEGGDPEATVDRLLTRPIPPASRHGHSPPSLDAICFKALQRSPAKRYQSAEEMLVHLRKVAAAEDLMGSPSEVAEWVKEARRGRELDLARLSFLDASRMARQVERGASPGAIPVPNLDGEGPEPNESSQTMDIASDARRRDLAVKWLAVLLGLGIVLLAVLLPDTVKNLGKLGSGRSVDDDGHAGQRQLPETTDRGVVPGSSPGTAEATPVRTTDASAVEDAGAGRRVQ